MLELAGQLEAFVEGVRHHVDLSWAPDARIAAGLLFGAGLLLAFWGAKLVRVAVVLAFVGLGVWGGLHAAEAAGITPLAGMLAGGGVGGAVGFFLFRLWVGVLSAVALSLIALGAVSYRQVLPHVSAYDATVAVVGSHEQGQFVLPSPEEQQSRLNADAGQYLGGLWSYVGKREPTLPRNVLAVLAAATFAGVTIGLLLPGFMAVLGTAAAGTLLVAGSAWWVLKQYRPDLLQFLQQRPTIGLGLLAAFCLSSVLIQWLGARPDRTTIRKSASAAA